MESAISPEQRLLRRATLYTADHEAAQRVLVDVLRAAPDLARQSEHRRDRLLIQRSRELRPRPDLDADQAPAGDLSLSPAAAQLWQAISSLDCQQRESWLLLSFEQYDEIPAARAMDCSRTAMTRFHDSAQKTIAQLLGDRAGDAVEELRRALDELEVDESMRRIDALLARHRHRRRLTTVGMFALLFAAMGLISWVGFDLMRSDDDRIDLQREQTGQPGDLSPEEHERLEALRQQEQAPAAGRVIKRP